jgi:hypothetical protein
MAATASLSVVVDAHALRRQARGAFPRMAAAGLQEPDSGWETFIPESRVDHFGNHAAKGTPNRPETVPGIPG